MERDSGLLFLGLLNTKPPPERGEKGIKMNNVIQMETTNYLIPTNNIIKVVRTKKGKRYYKGSVRSMRFFPLSKKDFNEMDKSNMEIFEKVNDLFVKIK